MPPGTAVDEAGDRKRLDGLQTENNNTIEDDLLDFNLQEIFSDWELKLLKKTDDQPSMEPLELNDAGVLQAVKENAYYTLLRAFKVNKQYNLEQPDHLGVTLAMIAAQHGYDDVLELLVMRGANVNAVTENGTTALMMASDQGLLCTVDLLIMMGAHMNLCNRNDETAIIKAVKKGQKTVVKSLLTHGANFASPHNGDTPLRYASHNREILDLINAHISRVTIEFERQVSITLNNTAKTQCAVFAMQCFALREADSFKVHFKHELLPPRPGVGMILFIAHSRITSQEVCARFYGPCAVTSVLLNGVLLHPLTEEANFVLSFGPLHNGRNELEIRTVRAPTSKAKLLVCAYKTQLL